MASIADLRQEYTQARLDIREVAEDPMVQFKRWFHEATEAQIREPNAVTLATADATGQPYARAVLLKGIENDQFVFYTNYDSNKGKHIANNPKVSLSFLWLDLERQVNIVGEAEKIDPVVSDEYFASRPRGSQEGTWVSPQSEPIEDRAILDLRAADVRQRYANQPVPRPPYWGGYAVTPQSIEFWQGRPSRLHDRILYTRQEGGLAWERIRLAP